MSRKELVYLSPLLKGRVFVDAKALRLTGRPKIAWGK
jgi:hypothetical protein